VADAVNEVSKLSKPGSSLEAKRDTSQHLRNARNAYWEHIRDHGCGDPTERLKVINQKPPSKFWS